MITVTTAATMMVIRWKEEPDTRTPVQTFDGH